ncbi:MAG: RNA polymerase factor sigma-54 [Chloroflexaceae bacterium]|nr:RNA polymerase factor sigma-54 [Chloroflexaceae bacterium]
MSMGPRMEMQANPALLHLAQLLLLPGIELQQAVEQELAENPSLEEIEGEEVFCSRCGGVVVDGICLQCASAPAADDFAPALPSDPSDDAGDSLQWVAAPRSMAEGIYADLSVALPEADHPIALALVGSLDERGFLADELTDIAATLNFSLERVSRVLACLHDLGPPGIATRNTRECLLAQLDALEQQGTSCPYARVIVDRHLEDLGTHRFVQIARQLHITPADVEAVQAFVQHHLWPYPSQVAPQPATAPVGVRYRMPDLSISEKDQTFVVEVLNSPRRLLRMNPLYQELARNAMSLDEEERAHVQEYVARTRVFLANLRQRESTLKRIGEAIVRRQEAFLRHGIRHLVPMTRAELAAELELSESTVSRAVTDKTVLLPTRALFPLSEFFVAARRVQDVLRELIDGETTPLSDQALAKMLTERGYPIARRTVAKYRDQMHILPSNLR